MIDSANPCSGKAEFGEEVRDRDGFGLLGVHVEIVKQKMIGGNHELGALADHVYQRPCRARSALVVITAILVLVAGLPAFSRLT